MPTMKPNFNSPLDLTHGRTRVEAEGPLHWNDTQSKCKIDVTIVQGAVKATGESNEYDTDKPDWEAEARTRHDAQLAPGAAVALGVVKLEDEDEEQPDPWVQPVTLRDAPN
jgi:hypothetical protein